MEVVDDHHRLLRTGVIIGGEGLRGETASALVDGNHFEVVEHVRFQFQFMTLALDISAIIEISTTL